MNSNLTRILPILLFLTNILSPIFGDQYFTTYNNEVIRIHVVQMPDEINQTKSREILVHGFMNAYEDIPLEELSPTFKSTGDVRRFYNAYFDDEFERFRHGHLIWIEAYINEKLAGWATFEIEPNETDAVYMNLLVVSPNHQKKNVGTHLVFSVLSEELYPNTNAINLLIRKINESGYLFYKKIGFFDFNYQRDNFVDVSLLKGLRWQRIAFP